MKYYVYILTNKNSTVLYTGITSNLEQRLEEHKSKEILGFTKKYNVDRLIHFEEFQEVLDALAREKQIKRWSRSAKERLIAKTNPNWIEINSLPT